MHLFCAFDQRWRREAQPKLEAGTGGIDGTGRQRPTDAPTIQPGDDARLTQTARFQITRNGNSGRAEAAGGPRLGGHQSARAGRPRKRTGPGQTTRTEERDTEGQTKDGRRRRGTTKPEMPQAKGQHGRAGGTNTKPPKAATEPAGRAIETGWKNRPKGRETTKKP